MKKALLVIDMQEATVGESHAKIFNYSSELLSKVNEEIDKNKGSIVIYIRTLMKNNLLSKFTPVKCFDGTTEAELVKGLELVSNHIFNKYKGDAFSNVDLNTFLKENNVDTIEVVGLDGGGCVSLTSFGAVKAGYHVIINTSAIGTMFENKREKYYKKLQKMGVEFK